MTTTDDELNELLGGAHIAVLGTVDPRGRPHLVPIWYLWRDGEALMLTARSSKKWRNILANPNASLCIDIKQPPYKVAVLQGEASEATEIEYVPLLREMAIHYLGERAGNQYADNSSAESSTSVVFRLKPARIIRPMG
jgi:PPOX class probable F420-dependent enzyme